MSDQYQSGPASLFASAARETPDFCLDILMSTFDGKTGEVIGIKFGERGYYKTTYGRQTQEWVVSMNARIGIDQATTQAFATCSLFGNWGNYETVLEHIKDALRKQAAHWVGRDQRGGGQ